MRQNIRYFGSGFYKGDEAGKPVFGGTREEAAVFDTFDDAQQKRSEWDNNTFVMTVAVKMDADSQKSS